MPPEQQHITLSVSELEGLLERLVRSIVREELQAYLPALGVYLQQSGEQEDDGDKQLLQEALAALEHARKHPETVQAWATFTGELLQSEAAGELPD